MKQKSKEDSEQENSSDARDPSVEEEERLLALDKDIYDEEDETIAQDVANENQESQDSYCGTGERKLVCLDETSKLLMLCFKTRILRGFYNTSVGCNSVSNFLWIMLFNWITILLLHT